MELTATNYIAGYAALVATGSLGWQVWNSYRAKRPQVTLLMDTWRSSWTGRNPTIDAADIRIRNREEYVVRVDRLYFRYLFPESLFSRPIAAEIEIGDVTELPFEVLARDVVSLTVRPSQPYAATRTGFKAVLTTEMGMVLRTGERYRSKQTRQR